MRVAFFTAGTVGAGHLARGFAIGRALRRAGSGWRGRYRVFAPRTDVSEKPALVDALEAAGVERETVAIDEAILRSPHAAAASELARGLRAFAPDLVLVDMFWAPLRHILPLPGADAWLLLRSFPPTWLIGPPGFGFDASQFARIFAIEPVATTYATDVIEPVVVTNLEECRPRGALRERLGVAPGRRLVAVMHAGREGEHRRIAEAAAAHADATIAMFHLTTEAPLFPVAEWLGDCDAIHCGAGYNAFWEAKWLGYAARTTFTAFDRVNDDQRWRLAKCVAYPMRANGADMLATRILRG